MHATVQGVNYSHSSNMQYIVYFFLVSFFFSFLACGSKHAVQPCSEFNFLRTFQFINTVCELTVKDMKIKT